MRSPYGHILAKVCPESGPSIRSQKEVYIVNHYMWAQMDPQTAAAFGQNFGQNVALRICKFFLKSQKLKSSFVTNPWPYFGQKRHLVKHRKHLSWSSKCVKIEAPNWLEKGSQTQYRKTLQNPYFGVFELCCFQHENYYGFDVKGRQCLLKHMVVFGYVQIIHSSSWLTEVHSQLKLFTWRKHGDNAVTCQWQRV